MNTGLNSVLNRILEKQKLKSKEETKEVKYNCTSCKDTSWIVNENG